MPISVTKFASSAAHILLTATLVQPSSLAAQAAAWTVSREPTLQIGRESGPADYLFTRIVGVRRLEDGRIAVADGSDPSIRFYSPQGTFLRKTGGRGDGPGEFTMLTGMVTTASELWGISGGGDPTHVFDLNGRYLRTYAGAKPIAVLSDGSYVIQKDVRRVFPEGTAPRLVFTDSLVLSRVHAKGDTVPIVRLPRAKVVTYTDRIDRPGSPVIVSTATPVQAYGALAHVFVRGNLIYHGFSDRYEITVFDSGGRKIRTIRRALQPVRVTEAERRAFTNFYLTKPTEFPPGSWRAQYDLAQLRARAENVVFPEFHVAFSNLHVDQQNNLWVQQLPPYRAYNPIHGGVRADHTNERVPSKWDVFTAEGVFRGTVDLPAGLEVHEIGADYVAGVWSDELGVPYVRIHALRK